MEISALIGFALVSATLIVVPGPDWAYVLAAGSRDKNVLRPVLGILAGYGVITIAEVLGLGALVANIPWMLTALTITGSLYLGYLGFKLLTSKPEPLNTAATVDTQDAKKALFLRGMAVSGLNPKGLLLYLAILPQFVSRDGWPIWNQFLILGLIFISITGMVYSLIGHFAKKVLSTNESATKITTRVAGISMIVVGIVLLVERLVSENIL